MNSAGRPDMGDSEGAQMLGTTSVASYYGPSFMIDDLTYHYEHADHHTVLINCHYPIDANSFVLQYGIIVKKSDALPDDLAMQTAISLGDFVKMGFEQDVEIWRNKARIDNPLLVEEDGPVYQLRRWYQQFYVDVADVQPDMVDRFEFELDTTRPYEAWMKEIEANMAARRQARCDDVRFVGQGRQPSRRDAHGAGGVPHLRCAGAGPQEQLESDQRAVERRRDGTVCRARASADHIAGHGSRGCSWRVRRSASR